MTTGRAEARPVPRPPLERPRLWSDRLRGRISRRLREPRAEPGALIVEAGEGAAISAPTAEQRTIAPDTLVFVACFPSKIENRTGTGGRQLNTRARWSGRLRGRIDPLPPTSPRKARGFNRQLAPSPHSTVRPAYAIFHTLKARGFNCPGRTSIGRDRSE